MCNQEIHLKKKEVMPICIYRINNRIKQARNTIKRNVCTRVVWYS